MKKNPWKVKSILAFACLNCPECDFNTKEETFFQDHAVEKHPLSFVFFGKIKSANLLPFLNLKETEDEINSSVAMQDGNSVHEINTNHKTLYLDPSEKSIIKSANPGNEITLQNTTTISLDARFTHLQNKTQKPQIVSGPKLTPMGTANIRI